MIEAPTELSPTEKVKLFQQSGMSKTDAIKAYLATREMLRPKLVQLSYSGGRASHVLGEKVLRGEIKTPFGCPIIFTCANPGMENPETHTFTALMEAKCKKAGIPFLRSNKSLYDDMLAAKGLGKTRFDFPALFTKDRETGKIGQIDQRCTKEFKIAPMDRLARHWMDANLNISKKSKRIGRKILQKWIGFTYDEVLRIKTQEHQKYVCFDWPLVNERMTSEDLVAYLNSIGEPIPPRSVCNACFANDANYFRMLYEKYPTTAWVQAVTVDDYVRDLSQFGMRDECYVYAGCISLRELQERGFPDLVKATARCHTGHCFN
jgi:hypothetical protein